MLPPHCNEHMTKERRPQPLLISLHYISFIYQIGLGSSLFLRILMQDSFLTQLNDSLVDKWVVPTGDNKIGKLPQDHAEDS
mgnify:CR=1 FL=1